MTSVFTPKQLQPAAKKKETRSKVAIGVVFLLAVFAVLSLRSDTFTVSVPALVVVWPTPGANLVERQTLMVSVENVDTLAADQQVMWEVEGNAARGTMVFDGHHYVAEVDTTMWDWKKDNAYKIHFTIAVIGSDEPVARVSVPVYTGATTLATTDTSPEDVALPRRSLPVDAPQVAAVYQGGLATQPPAAAALSTAPASPLRVEWVPAPARSNQQFIYTISGYDPATLMAFWQAEGGHKNVFYETNSRGQFTVAINFFGWLWKGKGPYPISFVIADKQTSTEIAREEFALTWQGIPGQSDFLIESRGIVTARTVVPPPASTAPVVAVPPLLVPAGQTLSRGSVGREVLFTAPKPAVENSLTALDTSREREAVSYIKEQPNAVWLNGDAYETEGFVNGLLIAAEEQKKLPTFVLYNIPQRDCGSYSSGGVASVEAYKAWIDRLAKVFANREAIIIIEPDALPQLNCLAASEQREQRLEMLRYATETLRGTSDSLRLYIDAGHPLWVNAEEMAERLKKAGVAAATGFSLNVSNFVATKDNVTYGNYLSNLLGGKRYVVDTSRNGNGPSPQREWCNPSGRALGPEPRLFSGSAGALDAYLWIKFPGESDGTCAGGPSAGQWWLTYAVALFYN